MNLPRLHVIATDAVAGHAEFLDQCGDMQDRCGSELAIHLRLSDTPVRRALVLAERLEEGAVETGGWLVINGRVDVALVAGADAVQLGRDSLSIEAVRYLVGDSLAIGASVHDLPTADIRRKEGADFLVVGTVFATATHPDVTPGGPVLIKRVADAGLPIIAIGGLNLERLGAVRTAGAHGVAVIRAVWDEPDPATAAEMLCARLMH
ncbi:MAG: thiamine phosphate synthase [Gammaproteobacteria bacterium]|nr:thiamine phosphate synthase [Gammaproteobacteria bacterium]